MPGLTVAALRHVELFPGALERVRSVRRKPFDRRDVGTLAGRDRGRARAHRFAAEVHGARAALREPASELGALEPKGVAKGPEQGRVARQVDRLRLSVDLEADLHQLSPRCGGADLSLHRMASFQSCLLY